MVDEFMKLIAKRNSHHSRYLEKALDGIKVQEIEKLNNLFDFYIKQGMTLETISSHYLKLIDILMEEQKYYLENNKQYRYSTFDEVSELYELHEYMDSYIVGLGLSVYLWEVHRGLLRFFISNIKAFPKQGIYLEIGPGHGEWFVTAIENSDYNHYTAIDISESSVRMTKRFCEHSLGDKMEGKYSIIHEDVLDYWPGNKFDAIVMGEVLEHVENPLGLLHRINELANDDAFVYVTTAINSPQPDHIYHFKSTDDIYKLVRNAKFRIKDQIILTANGNTIEKARQKGYAIVVGLVLEKVLGD